MRSIFCRLVFLSIIFIANANAQISGCTDPLSKNYNPQATLNDGSCEYKKAKIKTEFSRLLDKKLHETSGLVMWDGKLWSHNDDKDTSIYSLDIISGKIQQSYELKNVINKDWEEISQDSTYLYVGDFGNNTSGNRTDLQILRIEKKSLPTNPVIDTITFSYSGQTDFSASGSNKTDFDGEAFVVSKDSIYIFTKQWTSKGTSLYAIPKIPGKHIAKWRGTQNVKGFVTGATFLESENLVVLCGYSKKLKPFLYLLYDFNNSNFFDGNKRRIKLRLPFHQIEGIATQNGLDYYLTNENFSRKPFLNKPQKLHKVDLSRFLKEYLDKKKNESPKN